MHSTTQFQTECRRSGAEIEEILRATRGASNDALQNRGTTFLAEFENDSWRPSQLCSTKHCRTNCRLPRAEVVKEVVSESKKVVKSMNIVDSNSRSSRLHFWTSKSSASSCHLEVEVHRGSRSGFLQSKSPWLEVPRGANSRGT